MPVSKHRNHVAVRPTPTPSLMSTVKEGFSFGVGSSIAHNLFSIMFNSTSPKIQPVNKEYETCMKEHSFFENRESICSEYLKK
jgi:hypothetical protein